ncbi:hypothetical protein ACVWZD_002226 [Streptomyces sp. TE3672]
MQDPAVPAAFRDFSFKLLVIEQLMHEDEDEDEKLTRPSASTSARGPRESPARSSTRSTTISRTRCSTASTCCRPRCRITGAGDCGTGTPFKEEILAARGIVSD